MSAASSARASCTYWLRLTTGMCATAGNSVAQLLSHCRCSRYCRTSVLVGFLGSCLSCCQLPCTSRGNGAASPLRGDRAPRCTHAYLFADERDDGDRNFMEHREVAQPQDRFEQQCQVKLGGWRLGVATDEFAVFDTGRIHVLKFALRQFRLKAWIRSFMNAAQDQASHMVAALIMPDCVQAKHRWGGCSSSQCTFSNVGNVYSDKTALWSSAKIFFSVRKSVRTRDGHLLAHWPRPMLAGRLLSSAPRN